MRTHCQVSHVNTPLVLLRVEEYYLKQGILPGESGGYICEKREKIPYLQNHLHLQRLRWFLMREVNDSLQIEALKEREIELVTLTGPG